jgi:hypothetical protein
MRFRQSLRYIEREREGEGEAALLLGLTTRWTDEWTIVP